MYLVSHDLRTPLTTICGFAELARDSVGDDDPRMAGFLDRIVVNAQLLSGQLEGLLALSRISRASEEETTFVPLELARSEVEAVAEPATATVAERSSGAAVRGPQELMRRLIGRLLDNATRHSGRPDVTIEVNVATEPGGGLVIEVADDGVGIPPESAETVLEPFVRLDPHQGSDPRPGMGLTLCHRTARALGGDLQVSTAPGGGCLVRVWVPPERLLADGDPGG